MWTAGAWGSTWRSCCERCRLSSAAAGPAEPIAIAPQRVFDEGPEAGLEGGPIETARRGPQRGRIEVEALQAIERGAQGGRRRLREQHARLAVAHAVERAAGREGDDGPARRQRRAGHDPEVIERRVNHRLAARVEAFQLGVVDAAAQLDVGPGQPLE